MSSCYWQPLPTDTPLLRPWSENITTYYDALKESLKNYSSPVPEYIQPADRCWCDLGGRSIFAPFNISHWERLSVQAASDDLILEELHEQIKKIEAENPGLHYPFKDTMDDVPSYLASRAKKKPSSNMPKTLAPAHPLRQVQPTGSDTGERRTTFVSVPDAPEQERRSFWQSIRDTWDIFFQESEVLITYRGHHPEDDEIPGEQEAANATESENVESRSQPWLRRIYDLDRLGIAAKIDFGWSMDNY